MATRRTLYLLFIVSLPAATLAQDHAAMTGVGAELSALVSMAEGKFTALAETLPDDAWTWRPMPGVRSSSEVVRHVAATNYLMPMVLGVMPPEDVGVGMGPEGPTGLEAYEADTDRDAALAALDASFDHLRAALHGIPPERLEEELTVFGQTMTVRGFMMVMATHMHEHLGQLIAYTRANDTVPPWSASAE